MAVGQESVNIEVETRQAGKHVVDFVVALKSALKAGGPLEEAVRVASAALVDLVPVLGQIDALKANSTENTEAEVTTCLLIGKDLFNALKP